jgi:hypothetical protein
MNWVGHIKVILRKYSCNSVDKKSVAHTGPLTIFQVHLFSMLRSFWVFIACHSLEIQNQMINDSMARLEYPFKKEFDL